MATNPGYQAGTKRNASDQSKRSWGWLIAIIVLAVIVWAIASSIHRTSANGAGGSSAAGTSGTAGASGTSGTGSGG